LLAGLVEDEHDWHYVADPFACRPLIGAYRTLSH
jgi:hypothetical protein